MAESFARIPLDEGEECRLKDPSSPAKSRKVIPLQSFVRNAGGSGNQEVVMEEELFLEGLGYITAVLVRDCLTWQLSDADELVQNSCWGGRRDLESTRGQVLMSEVYAAEVRGMSSPISSGTCGLFSNTLPQMNLFAVHSFRRSKSNKCDWTPKVYIFGHESADICQSWVDRMQGLLDRDLRRPKNLLVVVNPYAGKQKGILQWETVAPLFERARVKTKVIITERHRHAYDLIAQSTEEDLKEQDGIIVVGGDGLFNEVLNGLVLHRHRGHPAPKPERVAELVAKASKSKKKNDASNRTISQDGLRALSNLETKNDSSSGPSFDVHSPLLESLPDALVESRAVSYYSESSSSNSSPNSTTRKSRMDQESVVYAVPTREIELTTHDSLDSSVATVISEAEPVRIGEGSSLGSADKEAEAGSRSRGDRDDTNSTSSNRLNSKAPLRIGIIPAGSTDTVAISTTGSRDPVTAALHILLGDRMPLDIVKITGWKTSPQSVDEIPRVRYAASFAGYGFYGDVMRESESARWLGPARYDIAGALVFLKHKTYKAEISFLDISQMPVGSENMPPRKAPSEILSSTDPAHRSICRANCSICAQGIDLSHLGDDSSGEEEAVGELQLPNPGWRTIRGSFHSVGGAVMSCRNNKAPDGLAAHAHLADGLLHLILIRRCSRPSYLRQLITLTIRGADPLKFDFVEHYKTPVFTFTSLGEESVWNIDGELFPAHQLTAQVCRGLVDIYACGPEI